MRRRLIRTLLLLAPLALAALAYWRASPDLVLTLSGPLREFVLLAGLLVTVGLAAYMLSSDHLRQRERDRVRQDADRQQRFLQNLDHELRNPLTGIEGALDALKLGEADDETLGAVSVISRETARVKALLVNLRKLNQLDDVPFEPAAVDLPALLADLCAWATALPAVAQRQLTYQPGILPLAPVWGEEDLLYVALQNLLDNALKYTPTDGHVELRTLQDGNEAIIEVTDDGPGIPEDELSRIWEPLYRARNSRGQPGSGLGLALTLAIVERHGGTVRARSRVDSGTSFTVTLPVASRN